MQGSKWELEYGQWIAFQHSILTVLSAIMTIAAKAMTLDGSYSVYKNAGTDINFEKFFTQFHVHFH